MKTIFILCGVIFLAGAVWLWFSLREPKVFGEFTHAPKVEVAAVIDKPQEFLHKTVAIEDVIVKQCTTMGCYFFFVAGDKELRVELAQIAMYAPRHRDGRRAYVEGRTIPYDKGYQFWASAVEFK